MGIFDKIFGSKRGSKKKSPKTKSKKLTSKDVSNIKRQSEANAAAYAADWLKSPAAQKLRLEKPWLFK